MGEPLSGVGVQITVIDWSPGSRVGWAGVGGLPAVTVMLSDEGDHGPGPTAFSARCWTT